MAATKGTSTATGRQLVDTPTQARNTSPTTSSTSLLGDGPVKTVEVAPTGLKRKTTDLNLEVITIDAMYDLTLIVGTPEHAKGQKAFRINKGSFRSISIVWSNMMSGDWMESKQSEIIFPDDSYEAFLIVLRIAHFQVSELPSALTRDELYELAILTDKYELQNAVRMGVELKKWLEPYRQSGVLCPALRDLSHFVFITHALSMLEDYRCVLCRLAVEVRVNESGDFYYIDDTKNKVALRSTVPSAAIEVIDVVRAAILTKWIACCSAAMNKTITTPLTPCNKAQCAMIKIGIFMTGLQAAGFYPVPSDPRTMRSSVLSYWLKIKNIGASHKSWFGTDRSCYISKCSFEKCLGVYGTVTQAQSILEHNVPTELWNQWVADKVV